MCTANSTYRSSFWYEEVSENEHEAGSHCGSLAGFRRVSSRAQLDQEDGHL
jgi:hypothetical protein